MQSKVFCEGTTGREDEGPYYAPVSIVLEVRAHAYLDQMRLRAVECFLPTLSPLTPLTLSLRSPARVTAAFSQFPYFSRLENELIFRLAYIYACMHRYL